MCGKMNVLMNNQQFHFGKSQWKVFLMTVTYLILPPASLLQNDLHKTVLTRTECWEALKPVLHVVMTNWKEQLDEFSSSVVWLLQRNCISETQQAETKKLLPVAVDLWSGSDWCCIAVNSSRNEWLNKCWNDETSVLGCISCRSGWWSRKIISIHI